MRLDLHRLKVHGVTEYFKPFGTSGTRHTILVFTVAFLYG